MPSLKKIPCFFRFKRLSLSFGVIDPTKNKRKIQVYNSLIFKELGSASTVQTIFKNILTNCCFLQKLGGTLMYNKNKKTKCQIS